MTNTGQLDPNLLSLFLNPDGAPGAFPANSLGGVGQVAGLGQIMPMEQGAPGAPIDKFSAAGGFGMGANASGTAPTGAATAGGGGEMMGILGMEALKGMQSAGAGQQGGLSSQAPVAPRGNQVKVETEDKSNPIDPRMYLMMQSMMGAK